MDWILAIDPINPWQSRLVVGHPDDSGKCAIRKRDQEVTLHLRGLFLRCWCCLSADEDCRSAAADYGVAGDGAQSLGDATGHADPAEDAAGQRGAVAR